MTTFPQPVRQNGRLYFRRDEIETTSWRSPASRRDLQAKSSNSSRPLGWQPNLDFIAVRSAEGWSAQSQPRDPWRSKKRESPPPNRRRTGLPSLFCVPATTARTLPNLTGKLKPASPPSIGLISFLHAA
jgi:hypothetical protein